METPKPECFNGEVGGLAGGVGVGWGSEPQAREEAGGSVISLSPGDLVACYQMLAKMASLAEEGRKHPWEMREVG